jgi:hypothetical protein
VASKSGSRACNLLRTPRDPGWTGTRDQDAIASAIPTRPKLGQRPYLRMAPDDRTPWPTLGDPDAHPT